MRKYGIALFSISCLVFVVFLGFNVVQKVRFEQQCRGYLKRAADASTVELAQEELGKSLAYLERQRETEGSTHSFYPTPQCDLGFWYKNLKAAYDQLEALPEDASPLTRSNELLKLRNTILDDGGKRSRVTVPPGLYLYPFQFACRTTGITSAAGMLMGLISMVPGNEEHELTADCVAD